MIHLFDYFNAPERLLHRKFLLEHPSVLFLKYSKFAISARNMLAHLNQIFRRIRPGRDSKDREGAIPGVITRLVLLQSAEVFDALLVFEALHGVTPIKHGFIDI